MKTTVKPVLRGQRSPLGKNKNALLRGEMFYDRKRKR
jgi:hypothetical protein